jgi:hypothetical protein
VARTLRLLIADGDLTPNTKLHHSARHPERNVAAVVVADGIKFSGRIYTTPSAAARSVTGRPVDGWTWWKLPNGAALGSLRVGS